MHESVSAEVIERARAGDSGALEAIVRRVQRPIYNLAVRMLGDPADAQDASQEILVKIITRLDGFRGDSAFTTWAFRIAVNHLLNQRERGMEKAHLSFEQLAGVIDEGLRYTHERPPDPPDSVLVQEAKLACTHAMLVCLERDQRLAYILGEILEVTTEEGAAILEVEPATFRKRLSRARERIEGFMQGHCGLVNQAAPCRCPKQVAGQIRMGLMNPAAPRFASPPVQEQTQRLGDMMSSVAVFRSHPDYAAPEAMASKLRELLNQAAPG